MKKIFLLLVFIAFVWARENPFVATEAFEEEKNRLLERFAQEQEPKPEINILENVKNVYVDESIQQTNNIIEENKSVPPKEEPKIEPIIKTAESKIQKPQQQPKTTPKPEQTIVQPEPTVVVEPEPKQETIALVKPTAEVKKPVENIKLKDEAKYIKTGLKFVTVKYYDNRIEISSPYKVFKKLNLEEEKKIVFDFRADVNFFTKRLDLNHKYFKQVAIGNHKSEGYFRVVVELKEPINKFDATYTDTKVVVKYK